MNRPPLYLMTDVAEYDVSYTINPWMKPDAWSADPAASKHAALASASALKAALEGIGGAVEIVPAAPGLPDLVFPANAAVVLNRRVVLARFLCPERQGEEQVFHAAFDRLKAEGVIDGIVTLPDGAFHEGAGDCIWDAGRGFFWGGYGQRSTREAGQMVADALGQETVLLELATPQFYHLDTCFCPLSGGEVLYYPPAFTAEALAAIRARVPENLLIEASAEDAARFCVNAVCLDRHIVMAQATAELTARLQMRGYHVHQVDLSPFILSGGAAFCMTLRLDLQTAPAAVPASTPNREMAPA